MLVMAAEAGGSASPNQSSRTMHEVIVVVIVNIQFVVVVVNHADKGCRFCSGGSHERRKHGYLVWRRSRHGMGDESVHLLRHFQSDKVMVVFFIVECASKFDSKFESRRTGIATIG
jgi:hypothetical protein